MTFALRPGHEVWLSIAVQARSEPGPCPSMWLDKYTSAAPTDAGAMSFLNSISAAR